MKRIECCKECIGNPYYLVKQGNGRIYECPICKSYLKEIYVPDDELRKNYIPMATYLMLTNEQIRARVGKFNKSSEDSYNAHNTEHIEYSSELLHDNKDIHMKLSKAEDTLIEDNTTENSLLEIEAQEKSNMGSMRISNDASNHSYQYLQEESCNGSSVSFQSSLELDETEDMIYKELLENKKKKMPSIYEEVEEIPIGVDNTQDYFQVEANISDNNRNIYGRVQRVSSDSNYVRPISQKLYEKIRYKQRMSDVHNQVEIAVLEEDGYFADRDSVTIVFHGNIEGGTNTFEQSGKIKAHGKMKGKRLFYADAIEYNDKPISISIERSDIAVVMIPIIITILFVLLLQLIPDGMTFGEGISYLGDRIARFIVCDIILTGIISILIYVNTRRGISALLRGLPKISFSRCFWIGFVLSTLVSMLTLLF